MAERICNFDEDYISDKTLEAIDHAAKNIAVGQVGNPVDLSKFEDIINE